MASILIVDDEKGICVAFSNALRADNHDVLTAANGEEAWDLLNHREIDVVISDIMMPGMHGTALMELLSGIGSETQVILMTGNPTAETAIRAIRAGAFDYLPKPILTSYLRNVVSSAVREKMRRTQCCPLKAKRRGIAKAALMQIEKM